MWGALIKQCSLVSQTSPPPQIQHITTSTPANRDTNIANAFANTSVPHRIYSMRKYNARIIHQNPTKQTKMLRQFNAPPPHPTSFLTYCPQIQSIERRSSPKLATEISQIISRLQSRWECPEREVSGWMSIPRGERKPGRWGRGRRWRNKFQAGLFWFFLGKSNLEKLITNWWGKKIPPPMSLTIQSGRIKLASAKMSASTKNSVDIPFSLSIAAHGKWKSFR